MSDGFASLRDELDHWAEHGRRADFWWRDDDAVADTPALRQLLERATGQALPLWLAVIPAELQDSLPAALIDHPGVGVLQHGVDHRNRAAPDQRKCEFPPERDMDEALAQLKLSCLHLQQAFGARFAPVLVPPWNRLAAGYPARLAGAGFTGLSTLGPRQAQPGLEVINVHADLIDWKARAYAGDKAVAAALVRHLAARRLGRADAGEATGIMSHHRLHDADIWAGLDRLLALLSHHPAATWSDLSPAWRRPHDMA